MLRSIQTRVLILIAATAVGGCASKSSGSATTVNVNANQPENPGQPAYVATEAVGWDQVSIISDGSEVKISTVGHWDTSRNRCWKPDDGAMTPAAWEKFVTAMNQAVKLTPVTDKDVCFDRDPSHEEYSFKGSAEVKIGANKHSILDAYGYYGSKVCTSIPDPVIAKQIVDALDMMLPSTFKQSCQ